jgi:hypothetical protein
MALTQGEEIAAFAQRAAANIRLIGHGAYTRADLAQAIETLGSRLEGFLKASAFPDCSRRDRMVDLIDRLPAEGLAVNAVGQLHACRLLYNYAKHETGPISLTQAVATAQATAEALDKVAELPIGSVQAPFIVDIAHRLWVAIWDYPHTGDSEIAVMLPGDNLARTTCVDTLHIKMSAWDDLKSDLTAHDNFHLGKEHFDSEVWASFEDDEFLNAGIWEGDYAQLLRIISKHEDRATTNALIPFVSRRGNSMSVITSLVMASVDIARAAKAPIAASMLADLILDRCDSEYALPRDSHGASDGAKQIADAIVALPFGTWGALRGPALTKRNNDALIPGPFSISLRNELFAVLFE